MKTGSQHPDQSAVPLAIVLREVELQRFAETLSQHRGDQLRKEHDNPELEKHLISVALVSLIEKAIRLGVTESEFLDESREIWDIQIHPEKYRT